MKIFSIFFHPKPYWCAVGGAEKRFIEFLKNVDEEILKITIVESEPSLLGMFKRRYKIYQLRCFNSFNSKPSWINTYIEWTLWTLKACIKCLKIILRETYDLILSPNNTVPNIIPAYFASRLSRIPLCIVVHHLDIPSPHVKPNFSIVFSSYRKSGFNIPVSLFKSLAFFIILEILKRSDLCIAVSKSTATFLSGIGIATERIYLSGNGVDVNYINYFKFEGDKFNEGIFVGRISREKGIFDLVKVWEKIVNIKREARLIIIGSGLDIMELKRYIKELDLEKNIIIIGPCSDEDMYTLMKASKVFIFPSRFEGWGLAVAEALACGLPVACYDIPALKEVFQECGSVFFAPFGDIEALASITLRLLELKETRDLAEISKNYVKQLDWKRVARRDLDIIKTALMKRKHKYLISHFHV